MAEVRRHVVEEIADPQDVLIVDGSAFPKKGVESCGMARQWCGRIGKITNCQVLILLAYAAPKGHAPLDRRLYLTEDWAADPERRETCHVPETVVFQEKWRIALDLLDQSRGDVPRRKAGVGRKREVPFVRVDAWAARRPAAKWTRMTIRDGEKEPIEVEV